MAEDETLPARRFRQRFDEIGLSELSVIGADASASSILSGKCRESALGARPRSNCWAGGRIAAAPTHHVRRALLLRWMFVVGWIASVWRW